MAVEETEILVTKEEVEKRIPGDWKILTDYLGLNLSWESVLNKLENELKELGKSFSFEVKQGTTHWSIHIRPGEKHSSWFFIFLPVRMTEENLNRKIIHELAHVYQRVYLLNLFKIDRDLTHYFEEAMAKVVSNKLSSDGILKHHLTRTKEIDNIMKKTWNLPKEEFGEVFLLPEKFKGKELEDKIKELIE